MGQVQRRTREKSNVYKARSAVAGRAGAATDRAKIEAAHAPWRKAWEQQTGKKYGIATAAEYNAWIAAKRKKAKGVAQGTTIGDMISD